MFGLKRDASFIRGLVTEKDGKFYCKESCVIEFPRWYFDRGMAEINESISYYGIFALIVGDRYSVSVIPTQIVSDPVVVREIDRDGVVYTQLYFGKGDCIIKSKRVLMLNLLAYNLFEGFYVRSRVPWYMGYDDLVKSMDGLVGYAGSGVGRNLIANELLTSFVARSSKDKKVYFRQSGGGLEFINLLSPYYGTIGVVNKLGGSYFSENITSVLVEGEES